jgi:hypothetical protein
MALAPLGAMVPLEMNEGTHYFQWGTKGLSVRPRCIGAAWSLPSGSLLITQVTVADSPMECQWKIPMTPSGIGPATFRFVAQYLNHCATAVIIYHTICNTALPLQQRLHERASLLRYTHIACLGTDRTQLLRYYQTLTFNK